MLLFPDKFWGGGIDKRAEVLASEPIGGRSWATELPCCLNICHNSHANITKIVELCKVGVRIEATSNTYMVIIFSYSQKKIDQQ